MDNSINQNAKTTWLPSTPTVESKGQSFENQNRISGKISQLPAFQNETKKISAQPSFRSLPQHTLPHKKRRISLNQESQKTPDEDPSKKNISITKTIGDSHPSIMLDFSNLCIEIESNPFRILTEAAVQELDKLLINNSNIDTIQPSINSTNYTLPGSEQKATYEFKESQTNENHLSSLINTEISEESFKSILNSKLTEQQKFEQLKYIADTHKISMKKEGRYYKKEAIDFIRLILKCASNDKNITKNISKFFDILPVTILSFKNDRQFSQIEIKILGELYGELDKKLKEVGLEMPVKKNSSNCYDEKIIDIFSETLNDERFKKISIRNISSFLGMREQTLSAWRRKTQGIESMDKVKQDSLVEMSRQLEEKGIIIGKKEKNVITKKTRDAFMEIWRKKEFSSLVPDDLGKISHLKSRTMSRRKKNMVYQAVQKNK